MNSGMNSSANSGILGIKYYRHPVHSDYAATEFGDIFSLKYGKFRPIKPTINKNGYLYFTISYGKKCKKLYRVHRFAYECAHDMILEGDAEIDHINHIKRDNRLSNLRMVSKTTNNLNRFNNREIIGLPPDAIKVLQYNSHKFLNTYFSPTTNCIYRYSDGYLFEVHFKSKNRATVYSTENIPVTMYRNKLRSILGYPKI